MTALQLYHQDWLPASAVTLPGRLRADESRAIFDRYAVPGPDHLLFQASLANFDPHAATTVDFDNATRAPLLLIAGGKDHIAPASVTRANFNLYKRSKAVTDYKEFPERSHYTLGQNGWEEVADHALDWALDRAVARPRAALADVQRPEAPADPAPLARSFRDSVVRDTAGQTPERPEERPS